MGDDFVGDTVYRPRGTTGSVSVSRPFRCKPEIDAATCRLMVQCKICSSPSDDYAEQQEAAEPFARERSMARKGTCAGLWFLGRHAVFGARRAWPWQLMSGMMQASARCGARPGRRLVGTLTQPHRRKHPRTLVEARRLKMVACENCGAGSRGLALSGGSKRQGAHYHAEIYWCSIADGLATALFGCVRQTDGGGEQQQQHHHHHRQKENHPFCSRAQSPHPN